jgi:hypothetical protein
VRNEDWAAMLAARCWMGLFRFDVNYLPMAIVVKEANTVLLGITSAILDLGVGSRKFRLPFVDFYPPVNPGDFDPINRLSLR